jgi:nitrogen fixation/metabolism regulation signal transduction histidine kinase
MLKRKKSFVDPKVQGMLVRRLLLQWVTFLVVASLVTYCLQVLSNPFQSNSERLQQLWWTHGPFLLVLLFLLPAFILDIIRFSHRFVGPIYQLRQAVRSSALQDGAPPLLKFRDSDFWQGLAEDYNQMVNRLSSHRSITQEYTDKVETAEPTEV